MSDNFDFLAWLDTGVIATREVKLYIDHAAVSEYTQILKELQTVENGAEDDSMTGGKAARLREQLLELEPALNASLMTFTVRAISKDELDAAFDSIPSPKPPVAPKETASPEVHAKFMVKAEAYGKAKQKELTKLGKLLY